MKSKSISELRQDIVSKDWVVIATGRAKRPQEFLHRQKIAFRQLKKTCPFETTALDTLFLASMDGNHAAENWWVQARSNKYPAFGKGTCAMAGHTGPYEWSEGVGFHEVVFTRDHLRPIARMSDRETDLILTTYLNRYRALKDDACVEYVSIFHNHGRLSGASIAHPHSQIIAIPVVPPDVARSLEGSRAYFEKHNACVHCMIVRYELEQKVRVIYENRRFITLAPYASKTAFEMRIFPKYHSSRFEEIGEDDRLCLAHVLRVSLAKLYNGLENPDLNFFLHTAPIKQTQQFDHYHWHLEILPKTAIWAGFEISTGIDITTIAPESAATFLRSIQVKK